MNLKESRLSGSTTPQGWKKVRNIAGSIATIGGLIIIAPVSLPAGIAAWLTYIVTVATSVSGTAHLTKK